MDEKKFYSDGEIYLVGENEPKKIPTEEEALTLEEKPNPDIVFAVSEISDLRGDNRRVYRMSDGTKQAIFYSGSVNVFDGGTGAFEAVDNTLSEEESGRYYTNGRNSFTARFNREEGAGELFSIGKGNCRITVAAKKNLKSRNSGSAPILQSMRESALDEGTSPNKLLYENVLPGADMEYSVTGSGVKENIIIKERCGVYRYPFMLELNNVAASFIEDEMRVAFFDSETGREVFCIPAPFMTDAEGAVSTGVFYEVRSAAEDKLILTVIADSDWINAENRAFPVTIDPQITLSGSTGMSTYSWNCGRIYTSALHKISACGESNSGCDTNRMYINLKKPSLPANPGIKKAELKLYRSALYNTDGSDPFLGLYRVTNGICTGSCTPLNETDVIDYEKMNKSSASGDIVSYTFDVTKIIDGMMSGEISNADLVLKMMNEDSTIKDSVTLYGSASSAHSPELCVTYESGYGVDSAYRTHTYDLGRLGRGYVDLQRGNLTLSSEDFSWSGNRMPVTIRHLYNSALAGYQYTSNSSIALNTADFSGMKIGPGWKLNIMQSMTPAVFQNEGVNYSGYVYTDESGSEIYFKESDNQCCDCIVDDACYNLYESVETWGSSSIVPLYDNEDSICGIIYRGMPYFFVKNLQGDVIAIVNRYGETVARYSYDAWGVCTITQGSSTGIAGVNPYRYRGYYYDTETDLYYLQSRYYDPEIGRFINADNEKYLKVLKTNLGYNFLNYCENNPIVYSDPSGHILKYTYRNGKYTISGSFEKYPTWDTSAWSSRKSYANCYAYALNIYGSIINHKLQPGDLSGKAWRSYSGSIGQKIVEAFKADLKKISGDLKYKSTQYLNSWDWSYNGPVYGAGYDVALVYGYNKCGKFDYHWYRKDSNGKWSHKRGLTAISNKDASGKIISDPKKCNRNYQKSGGVNYSTFVGIYRIYRRSVW